MADKFTGYTYLQGLILHDDRFKQGNVDATLSVPQQAGPEPDQPVPDSGLKGFMQLEALGTATAADAFNVVAAKEGAAVGKDSGGRFRWKRSAEGSTEWKGHLNYNRVTGFEHVRHVSSGLGYTHPHAIRTPDHKLICVHDNDVASPRQVDVSIRDPSANTWSNVAIDTPGGDDSAFPTVVRLPESGGTSNGGRLLCFYIRDDLARAGVAYRSLGMSYSDDDGATWTVGGKHISGFDELDSSFGGLDARAVFHNGFITLVIGGLDTATETVWHLVSDDLGASFTEVEQLTTGTPRTLRLFVDPAGNVGMVHGKTAGGVFWVKKGSPFSTFEGDPSFNTQLVSTGAPLAAVVADDGFLWVIIGAAAGAGTHIRVLDPGDMSSALDRWSTFNGVANIYNPMKYRVSGATSAILADSTVVQHKGSLFLLTNHTSSLGTADESLSAVVLGGYSAIDWTPQTFGYTEGVARDGGFVYLPFDDPGDNGWTVTAAGTNAESQVADGLQVTTTTGNRSFDRTGGSNGEPIIVWARVKVTTSGDLTADNVAIKIERADGVFSYQVTLRFTDTGARLIDDVAAGTIGSDVSGLASGEMRDWLIAMDGGTAGGNVGEVKVWYKDPNDIGWTAAQASTTLQDAGAAAATNTLDWGLIAANTVEDATWRMLNSSMDDEDHDPGLTTFTNPDDLNGRQFSVEPQWLDGAWIIRSRGSAAYRGDAWSLATRYQFGTPNLDPQIEPSPAVKWRSTDATQQEIPWSPSGSAVLTRMLSSTIGIALLGTNIETATFQGKNSAGSWITLATLDTTTGFSGLTYDRSTGGGLTSDWIAPNASTAVGSRYVQMGEFVGGYAVLDKNASAGGPYVRKITRNSEGVWRPATSSRACEFLISGTLTGIPTSDDCELRAPNVAAVIHNVNADYQAFRIQIAAATTEEGYFYIGDIVIGPVAAFGYRYSRGRVIETSPNTETSTDRARRRRKRKLGPNQRLATFAWVDGVDSTEVYASSPDPTAVFAHSTSARAIAARADSSLLEGVLARSDGGALPVVYLSRIDLATGSSAEAFVYTAREEILYGTIESSVARTAMIGNEAENEVHSISAIEILEHI